MKPNPSSSLLSLPLQYFKSVGSPRSCGLSTISYTYLLPSDQSLPQHRAGFSRVTNLLSFCSLHSYSWLHQQVIMIKEPWKYTSFTCTAFVPYGPTTWIVMDWDRRRVIAVFTDEYQFDGAVALAHFRRHINILPPDVYKIHVSLNGDLLKVSTDPKDDEWVCLHRPKIEELQLQTPLGIETIVRTELHELSRMAPQLDLVSYGKRREKKAVFKYVLLFSHFQRFWNELNILIRLSHHRNVVPIDQIVLDEVHGQIVGFASRYIPGGSLEGNPSRSFKLRWLKQLTQLVDDLNLRYGVVHHDIAARHLAIDPETDDLLLFDFSISHRIGGPGYASHVDISGMDITLVILAVYGIITGDKSFEYIPIGERNSSVVEELEEWVPSPGIVLDGPVSVYRSVLREWATRRREAKPISIYIEAPEYIDWPEFPYETIVWEQRGWGDSRIVSGNMTAYVVWCERKESQQ